MDLKIEMVFEMTYPFMNTKKNSSENDTNTIGKELVTRIARGNIC